MASTGQICPHAGVIAADMCGSLGAQRTGALFYTGLDMNTPQIIYEGHFSDLSPIR